MRVEHRGLLRGEEGGNDPGGPVGEQQTDSGAADRDHQALRQGLTDERRAACASATFTARSRRLAALRDIRINPAFTQALTSSRLEALKTMSPRSPNRRVESGSTRAIGAHRHATRLGAAPIECRDWCPETRLPAASRDRSPGAAQPSTFAPAARRPSSDRRRSPLERRASTSSGIHTSAGAIQAKAAKPARQDGGNVYSRAPTRMRLPMMSAGWPTVVHRSKLIAADSASGPCSSSRGTCPSDAWTPRTGRTRLPRRRCADGGRCLPDGRHRRSSRRTPPAPQVREPRPRARRNLDRTRDRRCRR